MNGDIKQFLRVGCVAAAGSGAAAGYWQIYLKVQDAWSDLLQIKKKLGDIA